MHFNRHHKSSIIKSQKVISTTFENEEIIVENTFEQMENDAFADTELEVLIYSEEKEKLLIKLNSESDHEISQEAMNRIISVFTEATVTAKKLLKQKSGSQLHKLIIVSNSEKIFYNLAKRPKYSHLTGQI